MTLTPKNRTYSKPLPANQRKMQSIDQRRLEGVVHLDREPRRRRVVHRMKYVESAFIVMQRIWRAERRLIAWRQWLIISSTKLMCGSNGQRKSPQVGRHVLHVAQVTAAATARRRRSHRFGFHSVSGRGAGIFFVAGICSVCKDKLARTNSNTITNYHIR